MIQESIEKLRESLSSPRLRPETSIQTYVETAERFAKFLRKDVSPTDSDFRRYFTARRKEETGENTLRKEFYALKRYAEVNDFPWPFKKGDAPFAEETTSHPAQTKENVLKMIDAKDELSKEECFYLAVATTFGCRRVELTRLRKRDYDEDKITLHVKGLKRPRIHMMPPALWPIMEAYHPDAEDPSTLSYIYKRICRKAEIEVESGEGWHGIRENVFTLLNVACTKEYESATLAAQFMGWSKSAIGQKIMGATMAGTYLHTEIQSNDRWYQDKLVYAVHPYLTKWKGPLPKAFRKDE